MVDEAFDELVASFRVDLAECSELLEGVGEERWAEHLRTALVQLGSSDRRVFDHVLGVFGGMGSFKDLVLHPINGHNLDPSDIDPANERLAGLQSSIYQATQQLRRALEADRSSAPDT